MGNDVVTCVSRNNCVGCGACVSSCPVKALSICKDEYGFYVVDVVREKCIDCGKCKSVCPAIVQNLNENLVAYAGISKDDEVLLKSSSGGIFYWIASEIIDEGGVVFGATMDRAFKVCHKGVDKKEDIALLQRSKYVQSYLGDVFNDIAKLLSANRKVLFCGTPCQVSAVKNFVGEKNNQNLYVIDVVCHGVPNQDLFDDYIKFLERKGKLSSYVFRYKKAVNKGMSWYTAYQYEGKKPTVKNWPEDSFNHAYMTSAIYRESCYSCLYARKERVGDISLCDYWGCEREEKSFSINQTVSGVLINSQKGKQLFEKVLEKNSLTAVITDYEKIKKGNGCLREPTKKNPDREKILSKWKEFGYAKVDRDFKKKNRLKIIKYALMRKIPHSWLVRLGGKRR